MAIKDVFAPVSSRGRIHVKDPFWNGKKKSFAIAVTATFVLLQLLFLGNLSYLSGVLFRDGTRVHNLGVLMVDYDQGIIGESLRGAYTSLKANTFPSLEEHSPNDFESPHNLMEAVRNGDYWAAIYSHAGASTRLSAALAGGEAAATYNSSDAITFIVNGARYPTVVQGNIEANLETLIAVTRIVYNNLNGTQALESVSTADRAAGLVLLNPITASSIDVKPTVQGPRVIYNTVSIIFPILLQFFFLMAINGISNLFDLYALLPLHNNGLIRLSLSLVYTLIGSLCSAAYIYAFRESWHLSAGQFFLMWLAFWLYMHINFLVLDAATAFIPMSFVSFFMLTWVILNISSTLLPFELSPGFYKWGYALPAHETYQVLIHIWTGAGGPGRLYQALPILFAWEIGLAPVVWLAMRYRCSEAAAAYKKQEDDRISLREEGAAAAATAKKERVPESVLSRSSTRATRRTSTEQGGAENLQSRRANETERDPQLVASDTSAVAAFASLQRRESSAQYFPNTPVPFQNTLGLKP